MRMEIIPDFPHYAITDTGELYSRHSHGPGEGFSPTWTKKTTLVNMKGYMYAKLYRGGVLYKPTVHSLVLKVFVGPRPEGLFACHNNGIKTDNRLENLRWDTHQSNVGDRERHGNTLRGERHGMSKLSTDEVTAIRGRLEKGEFVNVLAREYKVGHRTIAKIRDYKLWAHLKRDAKMSTKIKTYRITGHTAAEGAEFKIDADAPEHVIASTAAEVVMQYIDYGWEEVPENEDYRDLREEMNDARRSAGFGRGDY